MANSNGWGDGAANNSIGWGQGANNNIGWGDSHAKSWAGATDIVGITTDPAASAYFTATGITGATQQTAIDNLVKGLKADGLWSKMKAVYPFVTDNRNLLSYTEDFNNAYWNKNGGSISANSSTAPNGTLTADRLTLAATTATHGLIDFGVGGVAASTYTVSFYVKKGTHRYITIGIYRNTLNNAGAGFDLDTNTVTGTGATGTGYSASGATMTDVGDGWYRCSVVCVSGTTPITGSGLFLRNTSYTSGAIQESWAASGTETINLWGAQLELGSTATTYQPIATTQQAFISSQFKYNLVNPVDSDAAFRLVFNGGWTHSSNGATPNGTNGYADTRLAPSSAFNTTTFNHLSFYSRTSAASSGSDYNIGSSQTGYGINGLVLRRSNNASFFGADYLTATYRNSGDASIPTGTVTNGAGFFVGSQTGTNIKLWRNNTLVSQNTQVSSGLNVPNATMYISAINGIGGIYSNRQAAFTSIGNGLTDTEAANLYTRVQAFQTSLSRQV